MPVDLSLTFPYNRGVKLTLHCQDRLQNERPYIQLSWLEQVLADPIRREVQSDGRIRFWGLVPYPDNDSRRFLRVVTLSDEDTVLTAFIDSRFPGRTE